MSMQRFCQSQEDSRRHKMRTLRLKGRGKEGVKTVRESGRMRGTWRWSGGMVDLIGEVDGAAVRSAEEAIGSVRG